MPGSPNFQRLDLPIELGAARRVAAVADTGLDRGIPGDFECRPGTDARGMRHRTPGFHLDRLGLRSRGEHAGKYENERDKSFHESPLRKLKLTALQRRTANKVGQYIAGLGCGLAVALGCAVVAYAEDRPVMENGGVSIQVQRLSNRVLFCVNADQHHKISSEFGVEFSLEKGSASAWNERLPKVMTAT